MRGRPDQLPEPIRDDESDAWDDRLRADGLDALGAARADAIIEYRRLLDHLRDRALTDPEDADPYVEALRGVSIDELTHADLMALGRSLDEPIETADSLFRQIVIRRRRKQLGRLPEHHLGISKDRDQLLARALGLRTPDVKFVGALDDVPENVRTGSVLKPVQASDSRGVYYLFTPDHIASVEQSVTLDGWAAMVAAIRSGFGDDFADGQTWQVQEMICEADGVPARDLKFYSFYGEIGMILEASRHPTRRYAYFTPDGQLDPEPGRTHEPTFTDGDTILDRGVLDESFLEEVRALSRALPVPFMRLDYLYSPDGPVFNEMSSAPGASNTWSGSHDRRMGRLYHEAEIRLTADLLDGKAFDGYQRFVRLREASPPAPATPGSAPSRRGRPTDSSPDTIDWAAALELATVEDLVEERARALRRYRSLLDHLRSRSGDTPDAAARYLRALDAVSTDELTQSDVTHVARQLGSELTPADSFWAKLVDRRRKKQLGDVPEKHLGVSWKQDRRFARAVGVPIARERHSGSLADVPASLRSGTTLTLDRSGTTHAYWLRHDGPAVAVHGGDEFDGWQALCQAIRSDDATAADDDRWRIEDTVLDPAGRPANTLSFHSFFGTIGLIEEVSASSPRRREFFERDGSVAECGRPGEHRFTDASETFVGSGALDDDRLTTVERVSRAIPAPYMRLDFLAGADDLVFVAMSSVPGSAHTFNDEYDRRLGTLYQRAEMDLTDALLAGTEFEAFDRFLVEIGRSPAAATDGRGSRLRDGLRRRRRSTA